MIAAAPAPDCDTCKGKGWLREDLQPGQPRFGQLTPCPDCSGGEAGARAVSRLQADVLLTNGLFDYERQLTIMDLVLRGPGSQRLAAAVNRMLIRPFGLLTVWGGSGNGKTLALQILVNAWRERKQISVYLRLSDLLEYLRGGFEKDSDITLSDRYRRLVAIDLLAIDEFDKAYITDWGAGWLDLFMDDRYRQARAAGAERTHTILAMNDDPEALPAHLLSRLRYDMDSPEGFQIIHNDDPDARPSGL